MPRRTIADAAAELLGEHRALQASELGERVAAAGLTRSKHPGRAVTRALDLDPRFRRLDDGRWCVPVQLLDGAILTHRVTPRELDQGTLALSPDLMPLISLARTGISLPTGEPMTFAWGPDAQDRTGADTDAAISGPSGWLPKQAGVLLHLRPAEGGRVLHVAPGPEPASATRLAVRRLVEAVRAELARRANEPHAQLFPPAVSLDGAILRALADGPGLLGEPIAPLGEAFASAGLETHLGFVGLPGTDWQRFDELWRFDDEDWAGLDWDDEDADNRDADDTDSREDAFQPRRRRDRPASDRELKRLAEAFELRPNELEGVKLVLGLYEVHRRLRTGRLREAYESAGTYAGLAPMFGIAGVARVLAVNAWTDPDFEPFVAHVADAVQGREAAGPQFVLAACAEARGDALEAERRFRAAIEADPTHAQSLAEVARYETYRGDYPSALEHLRAAEVARDDPEREWLESILRPAFPNVGRNEPCPCGSGRKFKVCHLGRPGSAVVAPAQALLQKLPIWLTEQASTRTVTDLRAETLSTIPRRERADAEDALDGSPLLFDVALYERGRLRAFLDLRAMLLPEAEQALARQWLGSRRSLYEVRAVRPGKGLTLRDLAVDGREVDVADRSLPRQVELLDLVLLRLLPDGADGVTATDGLLVPRPDRTRVLELVRSGDGVDLLRWLAVPRPPPRLANMEGESLLFVTVTYRLPDPEAAAKALRRTLRDEGDGRFVATVARRGEEWLRGSIALSGDLATIEANSARRASRLERALQRAAPGCRLVRREERGVEEALREHQESGDRPRADTGPQDPELARAMDQATRQYEATWVDEPIPALGGATPRQAYRDPSLRAELDALLDDMTWRRRRALGSGLMDPARIRALLAAVDSVG